MVVEGETGPHVVQHLLGPAPLRRSPTFSPAGFAVLHVHDEQPCEEGEAKQSNKGEQHGGQQGEQEQEDWRGIGGGSVGSAHGPQAMGGAGGSDEPRMQSNQCGHGSPSRALVPFGTGWQQQVCACLPPALRALHVTTACSFPNACLLHCTPFASLCTSSCCMWPCTTLAFSVTWLLDCVLHEGQLDDEVEEPQAEGHQTADVPVFKAVRCKDAAGNQSKQNWENRALGRPLLKGKKGRQRNEIKPKTKYQITDTKLAMCLHAKPTLQTGQFCMC